MYHLTVTHPFYAETGVLYQRGQRIEDPDTVQAILDSRHANHVVKSFAVEDSPHSPPKPEAEATSEQHVDTGAEHEHAEAGDRKFLADVVPNPP